MISGESQGTGLLGKVPAAQGSAAETDVYSEDKKLLFSCQI